MVTPQEKAPSLFTTPYSPITEREEEEEYAGGGCGCFRRFCFGSDDGGESRNHLLQESGAHKETWVVAQFKKLKQLSEVVAGPKWKNLIRKIGKICSPKKYNKTQFQYSPDSYALNFAGGGDENDDEGDGNLLHSFSSRFAPHALISDHQRRDIGL